MRENPGLEFDNILVAQENPVVLLAARRRTESIRFTSCGPSRD
jgi:hypothetical protein